MTPPNFTQLFHNVSQALEDTAHVVAESIQADPITPALAVASLCSPAPVAAAFQVSTAAAALRPLLRPYLSTTEGLLFLPPWQNSRNSPQNTPQENSSWRDWLPVISFGLPFGPLVSRPLERSLRHYFEAYLADSKSNQNHSQDPRKPQLPNRPARNERSVSTGRVQ